MIHEQLVQTKESVRAKDWQWLGPNQMDKFMSASVKDTSIQLLTDRPGYHERRPLCPDNFELSLF